MEPVTEKIFLGVATALLTTVLIGAWRWGTRLTQRVQDTESFITFLKAYLLKIAVLEFHSPDPKHKESDPAIDRFIGREELTPEEIGTLARRIETVALTSEDAK